MTEVTCKYFQLVNDCSQAVYFLYRMSSTHKLSSEFLKAQSITRLFVNLDVSCTVISYVATCTLIIAADISA